VDTKIYGSQGQQRTAVLTMKFSSLNIIKEITGEYPVLLLDDVLSELDFSRKKYILSTIGGIQTVITCTGIEDLTNYLDKNSKVFKVKNGEILN
ncbi:MAG: DNA replication/repair protein RecF, partial [Clostridium sp.]